MGEGTGAAMDDVELLDEYARSGARAALERVVARHVDLVYSAAVRQVRGDRHLAEDVTQAVFVLLARKARVLAAKGVPPAGWLVAATRWVALAALRRLARQRKHERKAAAMTREAREDDVRGGDDAAVWEEVGPHVDAALARLRELDRTAVVLRYFQGRSLREVGEAMGVSEDAAKQRVSRAIGKLRRMLMGAGVTAPVAAITAAMAARGVEAAPVGLASSSATAASGAGVPSGVTGLVKGASWVMAGMKVKVAAVVAVGLLAVGTPVAVVVVKHWSPPALQEAAGRRVVPAATTENTVPAPTTVAARDWRGKFDEVYRLADKEVLREVPQPFIPERTRYFKERDPSLRRMFDVDHGIVVFAWEGGRADFNRWTLSEPTVGNVLGFVCGVPRYKLMMPEFDRMRALPADWVVRPGAREEELVGAVSEVMRRAMRWPVWIEKRMVEREVFVARGTCKVTAAPPPGPRETTPMLRLFLDKPGKIDNRAVGDLKRLFVTLGEAMDTEVVDETAGGDNSLYWCNQVQGGVGGEFRQKLLKNVGEQTGLTFTLERRVRETWVAVDDAQAGG